MNILIVEQPLRNRGDESAHRGLVHKLLSTYPEARITTLFYGFTSEDVEAFRVKSDRTEYVNFPNGSRLTAPNRWMKLFMMLRVPFLLYLIPVVRKYLRYIRPCDFVIGAPGGIEMGGFMGWAHIALFWVVKNEKKPIYYFGRSIGPFRSGTYWERLFKKYCISLFRYFSFLSLRDAKSQQFARELEINYTPTIDSAFLRDETEEPPADWKTQLGDTRYIVFVPNSLAWHHTYRSTYSEADFRFFWVEMANALLKEYGTHNLVMLPQTNRVPWIVDGYDLFVDIRKRTTHPDRIFVLDECFGSDVQQNIISKADLLIGSRYHSVIFAINQNVPFVSLSYEHKMNGVLQALGKTSCEIDIDAVFSGKQMTEVDTRGLIDRVLLLSHQVERDAVAKQRAREIAERGFEVFRSTVASNCNLK